MFLILCSSPLPLDCHPLCMLSDLCFQSEGGMAVNKPIVHHLLNRIKDFNEWSQCIVLEVVAKYMPDAQQVHASSTCPPFAALDLSPPLHPSLPLSTPSRRHLT